MEQVDMGDLDRYFNDSTSSINKNINSLNLKEYTQSLLILNNQKLILNLQKVWTNEKLSKALLKYEEDFISEVIEVIEKKEKEIQNLNRSNGPNKDSNIKEETEIIELDLERTKFLLKDYLRIRLCKIEKYIYFIIKNDLSHLLSKNEFEFAFDFFKNKRNYFNENFNKKIHESFNDFVPNKLRDDIIIEPPYNSYVYCKSLTYEPITVYLKDVWAESEESLTIGKDDVYCLPYFCVK